MTLCTEKTGPLGCPYDASGMEPDPELCTYHAKKRAGLFACKEKGCARPAGHRPPCSPVPSERRTVTPDNRLSDEGEAILHVLRSEGLTDAPDWK
jgi:hypothetical protein